jgi:MFS family permease
MAATLAGLRYAHIWPPVLLVDGSSRRLDPATTQLRPVPERNNPVTDGNRSWPAPLLWETDSGVRMLAARSRDDLAAAGTVEAALTAHQESYAPVIIDAASGLPSDLIWARTASAGFSVVLMTRPDQYSLAEAAEALVWMHDRKLVTKHQVTVVINHGIGIASRRTRRRARHDLRPRYRTVRVRDAPTVDGRRARVVLSRDGCDQHKQLHRLPRRGAGLGIGHTLRIGARRLIPAALATISISLIIISISSSFWLVLVLFTVTGLGSGSGNVAVLGLVSHWFQRSLRGRASGLVVSGSGYAIMLTGLIIPLINSVYGVNGWRVGWFVLALLVVVVAITAGVLLRNHPEDVGLAAQGHPVKDAHPHAPVPAAEQRRATWHLGMIYFTFGFSYVIYVTFIVTTLVEERGFRESTAGWFWFAFGFFSIFSGPIFGALSDRASRRVGLVTVFAMHTVAFGLVSLPLPAPFLYLSVLLFGMSAWSIPGIMGAAVGDYMGPHQAVHALGILTVFTGVGQTIGPAIAGVLADRSGTFYSSYLLAAVLAALGGLLSLALRSPSSAHRAA